MHVSTQKPITINHATPSKTQIPQFGRFNVNTSTLNMRFPEDDIIEYVRVVSGADKTIEEFEALGAHFKLEGVDGNNSKLNDSLCVHPNMIQYGPKTKWALVSVLDKNYKIIKKFSNQFMTPSGFINEVFNQTRKHFNDIAKLTEPVSPIPLGLDSRTRFSNLGDNAVKMYRGQVKQEREAAGLDRLPKENVLTHRAWSYWIVNSDKPLPMEEAKALNERLGQDIRAQGCAGGIANDRLEDYLGTGAKGVSHWHVDTIEGLAELRAQLELVYNNNDIPNN